MYGYLLMLVNYCFGNMMENKLLCLYFMERFCIIVIRLNWNLEVFCGWRKIGELGVKIDFLCKGRIK